MYSSDETVPKSKVKEKVKTNMSQIILASASPRRKELLEQIGAEFVVCPAKGEEILSLIHISAIRYLSCILPIVFHGLSGFALLYSLISTFS